MLPSDCGRIPTPCGRSRAGPQTLGAAPPPTRFTISTCGCGPSSIRTLPPRGTRRSRRKVPCCCLRAKAASRRCVRRDTASQSAHVHARRRVRRDSTLPMDGTDWETDLHFLAGRLFTVSRCLIEPNEPPWLEHEGRVHTPHPVNPKPTPTSLAPSLAWTALTPHAKRAPLIRQRRCSIKLLVVNPRQKTRCSDERLPRPLRSPL